MAENKTQETLVSVSAFLKSVAFMEKCGVK
jgi:hypothetical protein